MDQESLRTIYEDLTTDEKEDVNGRRTPTKNSKSDYDEAYNAGNDRTLSELRSADLSEDKKMEIFQAIRFSLDDYRIQQLNQLFPCFFPVQTQGNCDE